MTDYATTLAQLASKFPDEVVKKKPGRGNAPAMSYISHAIVTERLNKLAPDWSVRNVATHTYLDGQGVIHCAGVTLEMTIGGVSRVESGGPQRQDGFTNEIKNAYSDALKRCAMRFGVALYIWDQLVDAEFDEDVYPDYVPPAASAPTPRPAPSAPAPATGAARPDSHAPNGPRPPQAAPTPIRTAPPQASPYGEHAPNGNSTRMAEVNEYLTANGFTGGNVGQCVRELEGWVAQTFNTQEKIIPTGPVNPEKPQYGPGTLPKDILNYAIHFISQCDVPDEAAAVITGMNGGVHINDEAVPF
jgi:hypothetical protein